MDRGCFLFNHGAEPLSFIFLQPWTRICGSLCRDSFQPVAGMRKTATFKNRSTKLASCLHLELHCSALQLYRAVLPAGVIHCLCFNALPSKWIETACQSEFEATASYCDFNILFQCSLITVYQFLFRRPGTRRKIRSAGIVIRITDLKFNLYQVTRNS